MVDIITPELNTALKDRRVESDQLYARLIASPFQCQEIIQDMQRKLVETVTTLMEHNIPIQIPKKERTVEDVLREAAGEAGMLIGSKAMARGVSFYRRVKDSVDSGGEIPANAEVVAEEEIEIFEDRDTGELFYYDNDENEVPCDEFGNPLEE